MIKCILCKKEKEPTEFHKNKIKDSGRDTRCKPCRKALAKVTRENNYFVEYTRSKKSECKKKSITFDLTSEYLERIWTGFCSIFKTEISYGHRGYGSHHANQASLDRKDPNLGYIQGNVQWVCGRANRIKYNATIEELELILINMKQ